MGAKLAADILPKLKDIQDFYEKRGGVFVYVVSPSKAAHLPEYFVDRVPCPSTPAARHGSFPIMSARSNEAASTSSIPQA